MSCVLAEISDMRLFLEIHSWNELMRFMNEFVKSVPYDLLELHLIHLVARFGSFTQAGAVAGLSQSAITRQIQGIEGRLGIALFLRTTRQVLPTAAGKFLLRETAHILGDVDASIRRLREEFGKVVPVVRTGVSRTISLAYLPGFFFASRRRHPEVEITVAHESSGRILEMVEADTLDVGVVCPPEQIPVGLEVAYRFRDEFVLIASEGADVPSRKSAIQWKKWVESQSWLLIHGQRRKVVRHIRRN